MWGEGGVTLGGPSARGRPLPPLWGCFPVAGTAVLGRGAPALRGGGAEGAGYPPPYFRIGQEQIVVDDAPPGVRRIDDAHPEPFDGGLLGGAAPCHPPGYSSRQRQRAVVRRGDDGDLAAYWTDADNRRREYIHVD